MLNVDCANIASSDPTLYSHLLSCPTEVIPLMDTEARNLAAALGGDEADHHIQVRLSRGAQLSASHPGWQPCKTRRAPSHPFHRGDLLACCGVHDIARCCKRNHLGDIDTDIGVCVPMQVKTFNLQESKVIRDLNPADINCLISVSGMVTRTSAVIPDLTCAAAMPAACMLLHTA